MLARVAPTPINVGGGPQNPPAAARGLVVGHAHAIAVRQLVHLLPTGGIWELGGLLSPRLLVARGVHPLAGPHLRSGRRRLLGPCQLRALLAANFRRAGGLVRHRVARGVSKLVRRHGSIDPCDGRPHWVDAGKRVAQRDGADANDGVCLGADLAPDRDQVPDVEAAGGPHLDLRRAHAARHRQHRLRGPLRLRLQGSLR